MSTAEPARSVRGDARATGGSLVVQTSFLGDMVLTTPLLVELAERGPVDVVATPANSTLLANHPAVRDVYVYDKRGSDSGMAGLMRLASRLRGRRYSTAYMAQGSVRSGALVFLAGISDRVGFDRSAGRQLYTRRVRYREDRHHAERLWRLAMPATAEPASGQLRPTLYPGAGDIAAAEALLGDIREDGRPVVALAPGSAWATKRWPFYPELAAELATRARIVVVGGKDDTPLADAIADATRRKAEAPPVVDTTGRLSLLASAALLSMVDVLVTNDSLPLHLASAMDTPTVALFGPTVPALGFGPLARRSVTLGRTELDCRPCNAHGPARCPLDHWRCMRELDASAVAAAVESLLQPVTAP